MDKFLITDTEGDKSLTATAFLVGFIIVNLKLILSGLTINDYTFSEFSGTDYGLALGSLGTIYLLRRHAPVMPDSKSE